MLSIISRTIEVMWFEGWGYLSLQDAGCLGKRNYFVSLCLYRWKSWITKCWWGILVKDFEVLFQWSAICPFRLYMSPGISISHYSDQKMNKTQHTVAMNIPNTSPSEMILGNYQLFFPAVGHTVLGNLLSWIHHQFHSSLPPEMKHLVDLPNNKSYLFPLLGVLFVSS